MRVFGEKEAEEFLEREGLPVIKRKFVTTNTKAVSAAEHLGFPVVIKVVSKKALHKSDKGGVILDVRNEKEVKSAFTKMKKIAGFQGVLVQKFIKGHHVLLGVKLDPVFGHVLVLGAGGIYTEIMKDVSFRVCPVKEKDVKQMVEELKMYDVLKGARGEKAVNFDKLYSVVLQMSNLVQKHQNIRELDINPLIVDKKQVLIADARIVFS